MKRSLPAGLMLLAMIAAIAGAPARAADTIYRWKDERGNLVVSDRPPEDKALRFETLNMGPNTMTRAFDRPRAAEETAPAPAGAEKREPGGSTPSAVRVERPEKDPAKCQAARENLKALDTFTRIRSKAADGEYHYLTEEDKEKQRQQARETIRIHCD